MKTIDGEIKLYSGRSRSGKTAKCLIDIKSEKFDTVFVFDIEAQWCDLAGFIKITSMSAFKKICIEGKRGKFALVLVGDLKPKFEAFCQCVFHYASYYGRCAIVAEELAAVTTTAKAPPNWGMVCSRILKRGASVFAISQRWAEADKTCFGNASKLYLFQPATLTDAEYLGKKINVDPKIIFNLNYDKYEFIEANFNKRSHIIKNLPFKHK